MSRQVANFACSLEAGSTCLIATETRGQSEVGHGSRKWGRVRSIKNSTDSTDGQISVSPYGNLYGRQ